MESLRFIPVMMFLTGVTLVYAGFKGITPLDVIRGNLGSITSGSGNNVNNGATNSPVAYSPTADPNYVGTVPIYRSPGSGLASPRLYS